MRQSRVRSGCERKTSHALHGGEIWRQRRRTTTALIVVPVSQTRRSGKGIFVSQKLTVMVLSERIISRNVTEFGIYNFLHEIFYFINTTSMI